MDGLLDCFQLGAVVNKTAIKFLQGFILFLFCGYMFSFLLVTKSRILLSHMASVHLTFLATAFPFSKVV